MLFRSVLTNPPDRSFDLCLGHSPGKRFLQPSAQRAQILLTLFVFLLAANLEHVAWLALKRLANSFQGVERYSLRFIFFQTPECRMTYASFFGQPIEGSFPLFQ